MGQVWLQSALWIGLALIASIVSIRVAISVALIEIIVGALAGNAIGLPLTEWVNFLAGFGAIMLTFLAGTEIDPRRRAPALPLRPVDRRRRLSSPPISASSPTPITPSTGRGTRRRSPGSRCRRPRSRSSMR